VGDSYEEGENDDDENAGVEGAEVKKKEDKDKVEDDKMRQPRRFCYLKLRRAHADFLFCNVHTKRGMIKFFLAICRF